MTALTVQPAPARTYSSLRAAWIPLFALCLAFFVEMVDNTLLTIALPTIGRDLGSGITALQWVTGAYSLTFGGLLLTAGSMADRIGRRRVLLVGLAAFGTPSVSSSCSCRQPASSSRCAPRSASQPPPWRRSRTRWSSGSSTTRPCGCAR